MAKFLSRITVVLVAMYFLISHLVAQIFGVDILYGTYSLLFELCVVAYMFSEGKYHCKYMKWLAIAVLFCDTISHVDYHADIIPVDWYNLLIAGVIATALAVTVVLSIIHFCKVVRLNARKNKRK